MGKRIDMDGQWNRVSPKYIAVDVISNVIGAVFMGAIVGVIVFFSTSGLRDTEEQLRIALISGGPVFLFFALLALLAFFRVRTIGYLLREDDMLLRRGMLYRRFVAVPYGRMQIVDITQGPLERAFGVKSLKLVTAAAASAIVLPGLTNDVAEELRDHLVDVAESRRVGL
ncbi:PH domain-containing protein [Humidisolicoccus flavus]|uniref:PH domain-containing protein n=1 Tax=Humidisolicoccus flavus TaxID=3111414 RepID=UPI00324D8F7F